MGKELSNTSSEVQVEETTTKEVSQPTPEEIAEVKGKETSEEEATFLPKDFKKDFSDVPEQLRPILEQKLKDLQGGYTKARQREKDLVRIAETVNALAQEKGFKDFWEYVEAIGTAEPETATEIEKPVEEDIFLDEEKKLDQKIEQKIKEKLRPLEVQDALLNFAEKYPEYVEYDEEKGQILPKNTITPAEWVEMRKIVNALEGIFDDGEVLEIALSKVVLKKNVGKTNKLKEVIANQPPDLTGKSISTREPTYKSYSDRKKAELMKAVQELGIGR
jgi:hypothetical protein